MTEVFISYASEDRKRAQMLAEALEACGLSVWWDRKIVAGQSYDEVIEHELDTAKSVIVLWSRYSVVSEWVKNEAAEAVQRGTLVPACIDAVKPPLEFRRKQTVDLIDWNGDREHPGIDALCRGVSAKIGRELPPQPPACSARETEVPLPDPFGGVAAPEQPLTLKPDSRVFVFFWVGVGLLILAAFGLWYWDAFYRPHTEYYANVIKRWGLPEGVGRLTDEQVRHRNVTLAFTKRGRQELVEEIRAVNSRGAYPPQFAYVPPLSLMDLNPLDGGISEFLAICRVTFEHDANGQIRRQTAFNRSDRLLYTLHYAQPDIAEYKEGAFSKAVRESGITHIKFVRPETGPDAGLDKELRFLDGTGAARANRDGSYGYRVTFNALGRPVESTLLGADSEPAPNRVGITKIRVTYDEQGNVTQSVSLGHQGERVMDSSGDAEMKLRYDQHGNITELAFFGTDGQLITLRALGAAVRTFAYDDRGNLIENTFFGPDRQLVSAVVGFAKQKVVWDEKGGTLETYFGPDGKPLPVFGRVIKLKGIYDKRGYIVEAARLDENDRPIRDNKGCAKISVTHDQHGNEIELACFDEGDQLVRNTEGFARLKAVYDERGNMVEAAFFGPNGHPERYEEHYVKTRWKYNPQGNKIEQAHFDAAGQPIKTQDGFAKITYTYDLHGKLTELSFFDENGLPTLRKGGYARIVRAYDARGNMMEETFMDPEGKPTRHEDGYAKGRYAYDDRGYRIETAYYDERDLPTLHKDGCAKVRNKYNDKGQLIEWACFGLDGSPIVAKKYGRAKARVTYDAHGKRSRVDYFDPNDHLMRSAYGYATVRYSYDEIGRETKREFFDANGAPVSTRVGIDKVEPGSKSERIGLRVGDLIVAYDGREVADTRVFEELELVIGERPRQLTIHREGRVLSLDVSAGRLTGIETVDNTRV